MEDLASTTARAALRLSAGCPLSLRPHCGLRPRAQARRHQLTIRQLDPCGGPAIGRSEIRAHTPTRQCETRFNGFIFPKDVQFTSSKFSLSDQERAYVPLGKALSIWYPSSGICKLRSSSSRHAVSFFCGCVLRTLRLSQRTITCRRDPKGGFKHPTEMRLISKTSLYGDLDQ